MLSRDEVIWLYRCLLGRVPESEQAIQLTLAEYNNFDVARSRMMSSREFNNLHMAPAYYRPDFSTMPATRKRDKKLALSCILKNEAKSVEIMLRSALPVCDFVSIVDTGSTDDTVSIVKEILEGYSVPFAVRQIEFENFSQVRNEALANVGDDIDWILMLDGDEHLVPEDYWRLHALLDADVEGWQLPRFNFSDKDKLESPRPYPDYQKRLLRNRSTDPIRFEGRVHEQPTGVETWGFAPASASGHDGYIGGPHIHHMGQVDLPLERWQQKHDFYTRLLKTT